VFILAAVLAAVYFCRLDIGDLIAQCGQALYWQLGLHQAGASIIAAGDWIAFL
jgi:hypothetical protein